MNISEKNDSLLNITTSKKLLDNKNFKILIDKLNLLQPNYAIINNINEPIRLSKILKYPLIVKAAKQFNKYPHNVVFNDTELVEYLKKNLDAPENYPFLLEYFIDNAIEINISGIYTGSDVFILYKDHTSRLGPLIKHQIREQIKILAYEIDTPGLIHAQFILKSNKLYIITFKIEH